MEASEAGGSCFIHQRITEQLKKITLISHHDVHLQRHAVKPITNIL